MAKGLHNQVTFAGGEWSPKLDARVDQQKYGSAMRQQLNMISFKTGGLTRRPGSQKIGQAKLANTTGHNYSVRNIPFTFSPDTTFMLEFGNHYIRFYSNGQQVMVNSAPTWVSGKYYYPGNYVTDPTNALIYLRLNEGSGSVQPHLDSIDYLQTQLLEIPNTPYGADAGSSGSIWDTDIWKIAKCQINDVVYLVHPIYQPYKLTRVADTDWTFGVVDYNVPALLDQNATDTVITPSAVQGIGITLTASAPAWITSHYYDLSNTVEVSGVIYQCIVTHVSSAAFATDLASGNWKSITIFNAGDEGSTWQLATLRKASSVVYPGTAAGGFAAGISAVVQCRGSWEVHTYGVWAGTIAVERSLDQGITWDAVSTVTGAFDRNVDVEGTAAILGWYRLNVSNVSAPSTPGATDPRAVFECVDAFLYGQVEITGVAGPYSAVGDVVVQLNDSNAIATAWVSGQAYTAGTEVSYQFVNYTALNNITSATPPPQDGTNWALTAPGGTTFWSEAAWSNYRGFPQAVCSYQQRVIYGASGYEPQRIWGTVTNDIENFDLGDQTLATDSFAFDLNAQSRGPIVWLIGQTDLFAGFSGAEWVINSGSTNQTGGGSGAAITATSINALESSSWGSAPNVQPTVVGDALFYTQRQATTLRQMLFSIYTQKYMSQDLTTLSDHLFPSGIVQIAYQSRWRKQSLVWVVTQQGTLCGMTYELDQEVFGWHRHQTGFGQSTPDDPPVPIPPDNGFESVAVITGQGTEDDEVWVVANRLIGGVQTRFIERLNPVNWEETFTGAPNPPLPSLPDAFYVDCGVTILNPGSLTISGLDYLNGRYVYGLADGYSFKDVLVQAGVAQLPPYLPATPAKVQIGLPVMYAGQPMRIDQDPRAGNTQALVKQTSDLFLRVMNSNGGSVGNGTDGLGVNQPVPIQYIPTSVFDLTPQFMGLPKDIRITPKLQPSPDADPIIVIQGNDALPLTVLALVWKVDVISTP